ncbi:hypothetical protein Cni_G20081 [Canna indica]|uniref:Helitron helicase-like domain-containing protein n=1 Tax=Canna indica TaxID=4628 RepID=A0AAQ3KMH9_9LILI|nr:hypothetical protein Cni_G20081 [Canna indica]
MTTLPNNYEELEPVDENIVRSLTQMFDEHNQIAKYFRMVKDRFIETDFSPVRLRLIGDRSSEFSSPAAPEIAGMIVRDFSGVNSKRDLIVEHRHSGLQRVNELHSSLMSMQYPLLFPFGDDGFRLQIPYSNSNDTTQIKRKFVAMREYYAYQLMHRDREIIHLLRGGKLLQQFIVDAFSCVENSRLEFIRHNQQKLRLDLLSGLEDAYFKGDVSGHCVGQRVILPSSVTGSPRNMIRNYQDSMHGGLSRIRFL